VLNWWLGEEGIHYFRERDLRTVIAKHIEAGETDVDRLEGIGALNFLALDDVAVTEEGEYVDPGSVIRLPTEHGRPIFPKFEGRTLAPFLREVKRVITGSDILGRLLRGIVLRDVAGQRTWSPLDSH
jgi:hypothetical protein